MRVAIAAFVAAVLSLLTSCGGGGDSASGSNASTLVTELSLTDAQKFSLQGDWPMDGKQTTAFVVRSTEEWNQVWAARKAQVSCDAIATPYNQPFCDSTAPPPIDFTRYALVGILINSVFTFDTPTPRAVDLQDDGRVLSVTYRFIDSGTPTFYSTVTSRFFLVPQTSAAFEAHSKLCRLSC